MKILILILLTKCISFSGPLIDPRYDNFDGDALVFQLIADAQWMEAEYIFEREKQSIQKKSPENFHLIRGLFFEYKNQLASSTSEIEKSLEIKYTDLGLDKILQHALVEKNWNLGFKWLETYQENVFSKKLTNETAFLKGACDNPLHLSRALIWMETYLKHTYQFQMLKLSTEVLIKNKIHNEAVKGIELALDLKKIKSAEEALTLAEIFLIAGYETDTFSFLEKSRILFPSNELLKLNLAQVMFKKDMYTSALNLISELKTDDGLLSVQLELMNLMQVRSYSMYQRLMLQDPSLHMKNWFVYLINNENWPLLYSLHPKYKISEKWSNDEFIYAMAYSAQTVGDLSQASNFIIQVKNPNLAEKKAKLLESLKTISN